MDPLWQPQAQKIICEARPTSQTNGKAEYPWREDIRCIWWDQKGVLYYEIDSFLSAKPAQFFCDGIHKLLERWEKVIASDGQYFE